MEKQTSSRRRHRILALIFLISFLLSCGITWWLHTPSGEAAGFYLEKTRYRLFSPYYLPDPDRDGRKDVIGLRFTDEGDLEKAKKFMPELLVPGYIPEGWEMESLELSKTLPGNRHAKYILTNEIEEQISINESVMTENEETGFYHDSQEIELEHRKVYQCFDPLTELKSIVFYEKNLLVIVNGDNVEELLIIANQIN